MKYKLRSATMNNERFQKPDLLLALKANPKWKEVQQNEENQQIIHRVFDLKLKQLTTDITEKHILGQPTAPLEIVKICPKTNPLAYILVPLITIPRTKIQTSLELDKMITAEIPNPETQPELHNLIAKHMIHTACLTTNKQSSCSNQYGRCRSNFPKEFQEETHKDQFIGHGLPECKRRSPSRGGYTTTIKTKGKTITVDNRWVIPYNPFLMTKYQTFMAIGIGTRDMWTKFLRQEGLKNEKGYQKWFC